MGLIRAAKGAAGGVFGDQWKEYFYCGSMSSDTLVSKSRKKTSRRSSNRHGSENIISNGSVIAVNDGQCMIIVEQKKLSVCRFRLCHPHKRICYRQPQVCRFPHQPRTEHGIDD